ncbi:MAG: endonuclease/exonuclease/phosphatase family protein [Sphingomonadales bacterium]|nr:endonuclease/exonuclease/phosphatase family protein [Sphingomonadales bacterium]
MSNVYSGMKWAFGEDTTAFKRCAQRLVALRKSLAEVRSRKSESSFLLATWNIRDFDSNKFGYGPRLDESIYYIAEILASFDLIAVQEVNRDLTALERVMKILGRDWDYIATDTTEGSGGNGERMVFVYNRTKVWFRKIAGEIVLPDGQLIVAPDKVKPDSATIEGKRLQFARSPFLVAFQAGWFKFSLCTAHLYYGKESGPALQRRINEIRGLVKFFADRQDSASKQEKDRLGAVENYILLGDFNVVSPQHETMAALKSENFTVPAAIDGDKVRKQGAHFYDQIAVRVKDKRFKVRGGGMVDLFAAVFTDDDADLYAAHMPNKDPETDPKYRADTAAKLYRKWRTWQLSDHAPLWIEIETDFSDRYLTDLAAKIA